MRCRYGIQIYCSFNDYHIVYDTASHSFDAYKNKEAFIKNARLTNIRANGSDISLSDFKKSTVKRIGVWNESCHFIYEEFRNDDESAPCLTFKITVSDTGVRVDLSSEDEISATLSGEIVSGDFHSSFPVCLDRSGNDLRASIGKAPASVDHAVYNRNLDYAVSVGRAGQVKLAFDERNKVSAFNTEILNKDDFTELKVIESILANKYGITFSPINRNTVFPTAPVGWMTWYAVKFDACEDNVLKNAEWQAENLKDR